MIDWSSFSWEAFATLVTGVSAVVAAGIVGWRQVAISDRQTRILERQVDLDELSFRSALYEKRFAVYQATQNYLSAVLTHGKKPSAGVESAFLASIDGSKFLFGPVVEGELKEIYRAGHALLAHNTLSEAELKQTGAYPEGAPERETELVTALRAKWDNLGTVFGDDLRLKI